MLKYINMSRDHVEQALQQYLDFWLQETATLIEYRSNPDGSMSLHLQRTNPRTEKDTQHND